ncbi:hypothetical protein [Streptomyces atratus]|uniref:hypothetical protein n=1 Tax=Streptomyces atratus TaxID=1893 RepID=UPI0015A5DA05|nr:hypothetical protein [Streptomyces atratus]
MRSRSRAAPGWTAATRNCAPHCSSPSTATTAYVTEGFTRDGYGNGITVVDLTGKRRPFEVVAGARPPGIAVL